jgi:hypothetical protein
MVAVDALLPRDGLCVDVGLLFDKPDGLFMEELPMDDAVPIEDSSGLLLLVVWSQCGPFGMLILSFMVHLLTCAYHM